jgi:pimeloyl-ACP methyl ester carboxylesterase
VTLVFIHGAGCTNDVFFEQMNAFPGSRAPNLPGHGTPGKPVSMNEFAEFIENYARRNQLANVVLCGHSMGGAVALTCARRKKISIAGIVAIGGGARMPVSESMLEGLEANFELACGRLAKAFFANPIPERIAWAEGMLATVGREQTVADFRACGQFDSGDWLDAMPVKLLAITGAQDRLMPVAMGAELARRSADGESRTIAGAGHFVLCEEPASVNKLIRDFVDGVSAGL